MWKTLIALLLILGLASCKSRKNIPAETKKNDAFSTEVISPKTTANPNNLIKNIIANAEAFNGVRYKYGGTTKTGMDCSGLVYTAFKKENIKLPRISRDMAKSGFQVALEDVQEGDLLFFQTNKKRNVINHVGLVVTSRTGNIEFIHATTSKGVIVSSLAERYWYYSFKEARRIL